MKIGVIGYGNMGSMIVNNILKLNLLLEDEELIVSNRHLNKFESLIEEYPDENLNITSDNTEIAKSCEKILISVETPQFKEVLDEITPFINEKTHIIYTCAGLSFNHIKQFFDHCGDGKGKACGERAQNHHYERNPQGLFDVDFAPQHDA